jgi:hypothetical protein
LIEVITAHDDVVVSANAAFARHGTGGGQKGSS